MGYQPHAAAVLRGHLPRAQPETLFRLSRSFGLCFRLGRWARTDALPVVFGQGTKKPMQNRSPAWVKPQLGQKTPKSKLLCCFIFSLILIIVLLAQQRQQV